VYVFPSRMRSGSATSGRSNKSFTYRVRSRTSDVDESLFSSPSQKRGEEKVRRKVQNPRPRETVTVITKDLIRDVIVPSQDPSGNSLILTNNQLNRIKNAARVKSHTELEQDAMRRQQAKEESLAAAAERKAKMQELDAERQAQVGLNDLEEETKKENEHLLENARKLRMEQEDEIKRLSELILSAKCHAIRDAQMSEKAEIAQDLQQEEERLDAMMEVHRLNGVKQAEINEELKQKQRREGAREILDQIKLNTENKLLEEEKKNAESQALITYMEQLQKEDLAELATRHEQRKMQQAEIDAINAQAQKQKERRALQELIHDQKIVEYNRVKAEREAALEEKLKEEKAAKEREIQRLRSLQERAQDRQAEEDALRAKRNQEQNEREWREKERKEAEKKMRVDAEMRRARDDQINHKLNFQAVQAKRERNEFQRVLRAQQEQIEKENAEKEKKLAELQVHSSQLRQQIRNKETDRIIERREFFAEAETIESQNREHSKRLQHVIDQKLDELRKAGIDEKYVREVVRQLNQPKRLTD